VLAIVLIGMAAAFLLLTMVRVGGARRKALLARWPALLFALAALLAAVRGAIWPAIAFASLAGLAWQVWPAINVSRRNQQRPGSDPQDQAAATLLGVTLQSTESDIRAAYRAKMAHAHPDRGGSNSEAARLTAARDRLLRRLKR